MKPARASELRVGVFVIVALLIGGGVAFVLGNQRNAFEAKIPYTAVFTQVGGLRPGSSVRIAGVDVGTVGDVRLRGDGKIDVGLNVVESAAPLVRADSVVTIGNKGLLGDRLIDVSVGTGARVSPGATLRTLDPSDFGKTIEEATRIMETARETVENIKKATDPLAEPAFQDDIRRIAHNVSELTELVGTEGGTVHRLMTDPALGNDVAGTLAQVRSLTSDLQRTSASVRQIVDEVRTGDGTAHELVYGERGVRLVDNLAAATGEVATLMRDVREGDGTLHDIVYEDEADQLVDNLTAVTADLRHVTGELRAGRGTLGALLVDPSLFEDAKRLVGDLERNEVLRALVRYSIRRDEANRTPSVGD